MAIDINLPISYKTADAETMQFLKALQGNILKGHGRDFTANVFFRFESGGDGRFAQVLRDLADRYLTSAHTQLIDTDDFKAGRGGKAFVHLALSSAGYDALGHGGAKPTGDEFFEAGMRSKFNANEIFDQVDEWDPKFREPIHGIVLAAHENAADTTALADEIKALIEAGGGTIIHVQSGKAIFAKMKPGQDKREGIEHFGYVDGRSQPLMLKEDIDAETQGMPRPLAWDPGFPLRAALVPDPGANDAVSFGSYFIFRKLEQAVRGFKSREQDLADLLAPGQDRELAGAMIVGRFEDGTPVTARKTASGAPAPNDFNYAGDDGFRCPAHAHIRKTNPRGRGGAEPEAAERAHIMPRRGIPYEDVPREVLPADLPEVETREEFFEKVAPELPTGGVGLLFMAYNRSIGEQFAFTQKRWANAKAFPRDPAGPHGIDPVIGELPGKQSDPGPQVLPKVWDDPNAGTFPASFHGFVTMRGGEYFFSPSLTFLRSLGQERPALVV